MEPVLLVITNLPDEDSALRLAQGLVSERLAACVNILATCKSIYWWKGDIETASEIPLLIKTRAALYAQAEAYIRAHHPYEVPEIIAVGVARGEAAYLEWIGQETRAGAT